jgi:opine dehydrogenase
MNVTIIGAGNSGLAMAAHLSSCGNNITLWNRSPDKISHLMKTHIINCTGVINGAIKINEVTNDIYDAVKSPDIILITTPADSHKDIAEKIARAIKKSTIIVLNPGRTFGAIEFRKIYDSINDRAKQIIAETQTIIYTCRKIADDAVNIISLKSNVLISAINPSINNMIISQLPNCLRCYFIPARSIIETSIGNVGMILHCAPLLLNTGWTENDKKTYNYYYDGITRSIGGFLEKMDSERVLISKELGCEVESLKSWIMRTYKVNGNNVFECIQNNAAYKAIEAPKSLFHRYILEDVPCGLVPLEALGEKINLKLFNTSLIIDLASSLLNIDFRKIGRNLDLLSADVISCLNLKALYANK